MLIFDNAYNSLKQKYIVPLSMYQTRYPSLRKNNIKTVLCNAKYSSVRYGNNDNELVFSFTSEHIMPALLGDIWLCYIRSELQCNAAKQIYPLQPDFCPNWSIVSDYYGSFYDASTLLRLTMRGNIFLDNQTLSAIKKITTIILETEPKIDQNCIYFVEKDASTIDMYDLHLVPSKRQTHETVWIETGKIIRDMKKNSVRKTDELTILNCITSCLDSLGDTFPSQLRNAVNYQLPYGLNAIEKKIFPANAFAISDKWLDPILTYSVGKKCPEELKIMLFKSYAIYIHMLVYNLISEYIELRGGRGFGVLSAINKHRITKIPEPSPVYTYH